MTDEARHARMNELLSQRRYSAALDDAMEQLRRLGLTVARDDVLTKEAVQSAFDAAKEQDGFHLVWHRVWGVRLRSEVIETTSRLASHLEDDEQGALVWGRSPPVGFLVPAAAALRLLPAHIGPEPDEVGPGGVGFDLLLVADDGQTGLRLEYNHYSSADEYELRSWGRYARELID